MMFVHSDRIPTAPAPADADAPPAVRPWAIRLMAPYKNVIEVGEVATGIDPVTQLGAAADGELIQVKHRSSNTGTEQSTSTSSDGKNPSQDQDQSQDSDQD
ncbi:MAG: putative ATP-grasp-modified RiPP [Streptosporangiales bacterium]|nr:putative ATP-grasp-modified RiPP [Streptosporangiales bacterium]